MAKRFFRGFRDWHLSGSILSVLDYGVNPVRERRAQRRDLSRLQRFFSNGVKGYNEDNQNFMIHTLAGKITERSEGYIVVETGGVGFKVFTNTRTIANLAYRQAGAPAGGDVKLFSHLYVREDKLELYGFFEEGALKLFELLISVSGIGPKTALAILDVDAAENIIAAIVGKRPDILTRASGIGQKTAERVILELQNRIKIPGGTKHLTEAMDVNQEVEEALVGLGYSRLAVRQVITNVGPEFKNLEDRLRQALKILGRR